MIIAGHCLYSTISEKNSIIETANQLKNMVTHFRCKIFGGGTSVGKYNYGIGADGIDLLNFINKEIIPTGTEIHTPEQMEYCKGLDFIWIGARNSQNYSLLEIISGYENQIFIKRNPGMTIDEIYGIFNIMRDIHKKDVYIIERGVLNFDRHENSRWSPDLKGAIQIKMERPDIFQNLVIDCSHSVGRKEFIKDTYKAFKAIGIEHFMFECTIDGRSETDKNHMLSVDELKNILEN